jgi:hypothetical protein
MKRVPIDFSLLTKDERTDIMDAPVKYVYQVIVTGEGNNQVQKKVNHILKAVKEAKNIK